MDTRLANTFHLTVNEKSFIETALASDLRIDGRNPLEYRKITIKFGREDGSAEVQLGQTHVMAFVTGQLVQPYRDRSNEGTLTIHTEFSPMADPSFEPGRPGEAAVELGRVIDRGLRESRAVDMESLCVVSGKTAWAIRIDLHIIDNGGNLVDAANIAALAALLTYRRPECTIGGEDGQQVIVHPPEVMEPLPLIVHHLPIAVTFAFFGNDSTMVVDPTHSEEAVMGGRMTVTVNASGDICAIQKAGGVGVLQTDIMRCLRLASRNAESITKKIKDSVEVYNTERALRKIKRHSISAASNVTSFGGNVNQLDKTLVKKGISELSGEKMERLKLESGDGSMKESNDLDSDMRSSGQVGTSRERNSKNFLGGPSSWDPYSKGVDSDFLKASLASRANLIANTQQKGDEKKSNNAVMDGPREDSQPASSVTDAPKTVTPLAGERTLKDAVKPKNKRKKRSSSNAITS